MQEMDFTNRCGYQQHQILVRYYMMDKQLTAVQESIKDTLEDHGSGFFHCFIASLKNLGAPGISLEELRVQMDYEQQRTKAIKFVDMAWDSLHKHFGRWASSEFLPAALWRQLSGLRRRRTLARWHPANNAIGTMPEA